MSVSSSGFREGSFVVNVVGANAAGNAGLGEIDNPEGADLIITHGVLEVVTPSTGAANLDAGFGATGAKCSDLLSAFAINGLTAKAAYFIQALTAEVALPVWLSTEKLTFTGSADSTGAEVNLHLKWVRLAG
jgi:hypothetical protein